jgi:hypothetical protein
VDPQRTAFFGRVTAVREELADETGAVLTTWLGAIDLLILDDLDFGWSLTSPGDRGSVVLAQCLRTRISNELPVIVTAPALGAGGRCRSVHTVGSHRFAVVGRGGH